MKQITITRYLLLLTPSTLTPLDAFSPTIVSKASISSYSINNNGAQLFQQVQDELGLRSSQLNMASDVISPFGEEYDDEVPLSSSSTGYNPSDPSEMDEEQLELTWDNVDMVLDEMRPYLIQDGGNVKISEIDGPIVRLELEVRDIRMYGLLSMFYVGYPPFGLICFGVEIICTVFPDVSRCQNIFQSA